MMPQGRYDRFDETRPRHSTSRTHEGSIVNAILQATQERGMDPVAELYNEALDLATEGRFAEARDRLQVLLGLAPDDGDAHLLLAQVHVATQQWRKARTHIDAAVEHGASVPAELADNVVRHLQADGGEDDDERQARVAREHGELKKLRADVRRLRSENAHLVVHARERELETKKWMWIAIVTSVVASAFILTRMALGPVAEAPPADAAPAVVDTTPATTQVAAPAGAVVRDPDQKAKADAALAAAGFAEAKAIIRGTKASLSGTVPTHADKKKAAEAVMALGIVETVDTESLVNLAARDGATYTVVSGDTLSKIALKMYGSSSLSTVILDANPELGGKAGALKLDQKLKIPPQD